MRDDVKGLVDAVEELLSTIAAYDLEEDMDSGMDGEGNCAIVRERLAAIKQHTPIVPEAGDDVVILRHTCEVRPALGKTGGAGDCPDCTNGYNEKGGLCETCDGRCTMGDASTSNDEADGFVGHRNEIDVDLASPTNLQSPKREDVDPQEWSKGYSKAMAIYQAESAALQEKFSAILSAIGFSISKENLPELDVHTRTFIETKLKEFTCANS